MLTDKLKELFIYSNRVKIKDRLLEAFCPNIPKEEYEQYSVIFPLENKTRFDNMFRGLGQGHLKGIDLDGILFSKYTNQVVAYKVKNQKEIIEDLVKDFRKELYETNNVWKFSWGIS